MPQPLILLYYTMVANNGSADGLLSYGTKPLSPNVDFNSSPPGQNGRHFAGDIFRCIFVNEKFCILIKIPLKFVPKGPIHNNPALF